MHISTADRWGSCQCSHQLVFVRAYRNNSLHSSLSDRPHDAVTDFFGRKCGHSSVKSCHTLAVNMGVEVLLVHCGIEEAAECCGHHGRAV